MKRAKNLIAAVAAAALVVTPSLAMARAGGGSSMGSRGSMTYSAPPSTRTAPSTAAPMQRSTTQPSSPSYGGAGYSQPAPARSGFMSGLMGGLIGAGIGGLLLGHGFFGGGLGFGGFIGFLLQILLLVVLVRFLWKLFANGRRPAMASGPNIFARNAGPQPSDFRAAGGGGMSGAGGLTPIQIGPQDFQQFEQTLYAVQAAWSAHDMNALQQMATPEMSSYFGEQLAEQASRGVRNTVTDVRLQSGDLSQAWTERGMDYATVAMRFSMIDVTRDSAGRAVDGSPTEHQTATELWTFVRSRSGQWILSAIQQTR
ncbi:MAG: Tim44 domain-containing protein [Proteobacteria bacterium]|nr:Tim44 domain-containing protein [Pseudomonadota bacterium]